MDLPEVRRKGEQFITLTAGSTLVYLTLQLLEKCKVNYFYPPRSAHADGEVEAFYEDIIKAKE